MLNRRNFTSTLTLGGMSTILPNQTKSVDTGFVLLPDINQIIKNCGSSHEETSHYWGQVLASIVLPNILRHIDESTNIDMNLCIDRDMSMIRIIEHCNISVFKNIELYKIDHLFQIIVDKFCMTIKQKCITAISKPYMFLDLTQGENKLGFGLRGDYYL